MYIISAYNKENYFWQYNEFRLAVDFQDMHSSALYMSISTSSAFGYWMECLCVFYIAIITLSFFVFPPNNGAEVGLAITQVRVRKLFKNSFSWIMKKNFLI